MKKIIFALSITGLLCLTACHHQPEDNTANTEEQPAVTVSFNADSAYQYVARQVAFGPRVPNTAAHEQCLQYLCAHMAMYADTVIKQTFTAKAYNGTTLKGCNIIASFHPELENRILLAAHWDSRPYADYDLEEANRHTAIDAANDGASGVGVLMEIARQLQITPPTVGVDIILFDVEDYGEPAFERESYSGENWCLGSQFWAKSPHTPYYKARYGILLDMVGGRNAHFPKEGTSKYFASSVQDKIWNHATTLGYSNCFTGETSHAITDDHLYVNQYRNIPMVDIIDIDPYSPTGFNATWHTLNDNMEHIDAHTLDMTGKVVLYTVMNEK